MLAHRHLNNSITNDKSKNRVIETQAHRFSSAFQMPSKSFTDELWGVSIDSFRSMKSRWKVSIASMVFRAEQLKLINEQEARRLRISISRRGWRKGEPLDDIPVEKPKTIANSFKLLVSEKVKTPEQILSDLALPKKDVIELAGLESGFFAGDGADGPKLKAQDNVCLLYTSPSPRDQRGSRMPSSA